MVAQTSSESTNTPGDFENWKFGTKPKTIFNDCEE